MDILRSIWNTGIVVCNSKGYTFTATCMAQALNGNGSTMTFYNDSDVFAKIKTSSAYRNIINTWINEYKSTGNRDFETTLDCTVGDVPDLYYAIQHCKMFATVQSNGNLLVHIHDVYDFDAMRYSISVGAAGNDLGLILQSLNILNKFEIDIFGYEWAGNTNPITPPPSSGFSYANNAKVVNDFF